MNIQQLLHNTHNQDYVIPNSAMVKKMFWHISLDKYLPNNSTHCTYSISIQIQAGGGEIKRLWVNTLHTQTAPFLRVQHTERKGI